MTELFCIALSIAAALLLTALAARFARSERLAVVRAKQHYVTHRRRMGVLP
jgi:hypothetical protein